MYWSHVKLDSSSMSLLPHIHTLYYAYLTSPLTAPQTPPTILAEEVAYDKPRASLTFTSAKNSDLPIAQKLHQDLAKQGISTQWCYTNCSDTLAGKFERSLLCRISQLLNYK